jgi:hypothetical protein
MTLHDGAAKNGHTFLRMYAISVYCVYKILTNRFVIEGVEQTAIHTTTIFVYIALSALYEVGRIA